MGCTPGGTIGVSSNVGNLAFQVIHISADLSTGTTHPGKRKGVRALFEKEKGSEPFFTAEFHGFFKPVC
jgi:hypothetical protein